MEVATSIYPYTAWRVPWIHNAFENSAATISGVEAAYQALRRKGKVKKKINFIAMGGDGGTYDIGLQALSGAMERGHNMLYVCYDNEAYMNTGIQRSSATPFGAATSTSPVGKEIPGKQVPRKDLTAIMIAHHIPYVAQASVHNARDFMTKVQKALKINGATFINVLGTCHRGWRFKMEDSIEMSRLAVETCFWPLYEVENSQWKLNYKPKNRLPLDEWTKRQGRFAHLYKEENKHILEQAQKEVDEKWEELLERCGEGAST
jgi:pyruvate ferredoxin oxidoreductase beta subunit